MFEYHSDMLKRYRVVVTDGVSVYDIGIFKASSESEAITQARDKFDFRNSGLRLVILRSVEDMEG